MKLRQQQVLTETGLDRLQVMMWNGFREAFPEWESITDERVQANLSWAEARIMTAITEMNRDQEWITQRQ